MAFLYVQHSVNSLKTNMSVAVVTGSSSGIGRQTAIELARQGYSLVLHAHRNVTGLQQTAFSILELNQTPVEVLCLTADISRVSACHDLISAAFQWRGAVDVWVNNAGADVLTGSARQLSFEDRLQRLLQVDVAGTLRLSRLAATRMRLQCSPNLPSLINVGWDQAWSGMEDEPGQLFCTSKGAIMACTAALAMSFAPEVRVNCVAPGWIQTAWGSEAASPYWDKRARGEALLERWGTAADVAHTIAWLASPQGAFINGQIIAVNGGRRYFPANSK